MGAVWDKPVSGQMWQKSCCRSRLLLALCLGELGVGNTTRHVLGGSHRRSDLPMCFAEYQLGLRVPSCLGDPCQGCG